MSTLKEAWDQTRGTVPERIAQLRARMVGADIPIKATAIKKLWSRWLVLARCELFVTDNAPAVLGAAYTPQIGELRVVCRATARNLQDDVFSDLDPTDPEAAADIAAYLSALIAAGVLTEEQRDATLALGKTLVPEFGETETDYPALRAAGLITREEAGLTGGGG